MPIRITGLASGLDTESIISALVSSYNYKTNKYKKAQTKSSLWHPRCHEPRYDQDCGQRHKRSLKGISAGENA